MTSCCMNFAIIIQWIYFTIWEKIKKNRHHYNTISRHYKKILLRSQIYHGYEELSTDTNYPIIWRRQERSKYAVQLASWQLRSNSPKTSVRQSVCASVCPASRVRFVGPTVLVGSISYLHILFSNFRRCVACKASCKISKFEFLAFLKKL